MKRHYKRSDLNIVSERNYQLISYEKEYFIPIKEHLMNKENITIEYEIIGNPISEVNLVNYEKLEVIYKILDIIKEENNICQYTISPDNIYLDFLGNVRILERSVMIDKVNFIDDKIREAKSLLGYLYLGRRYEKLLETDNNSLKNNKKLKEIMRLNSVEEIQKELENMILKEKENFSNNKKVVDKRKYKNLSRNKGLYRLFLIILLVISIILGLYIIPFKSKEIDAFEMYTQGNFGKTIESYDGVNIKRMTNEDKYIYAVSTIKTQTQLNEDQKDKILANISLKTNQNILDYWIYIGQGNYEEAHNKAIVVNDVDMQIYSLLLLIDQTQNNPDLNAEDRQGQIKSYEGEVDSLRTAKEELNSEEEK